MESVHHETQVTYVTQECRGPLSVRLSQILQVVEVHENRVRCKGLAGQSDEIVKQTLYHQTRCCRARRYKCSGAAKATSKADNADSTALACGRLINADQLTGLLDSWRFFQTPLNSGFLRRRADQRVENASEDEGAQLIDGKGRTDTYGSGCGENAVLCDLGFNVLRQSGLSDANRAANRLATGAGLRVILLMSRSVSAARPTKSDIE
jgi:hypothetical protein